MCLTIVKTIGKTAKLLPIYVKNNIYVILCGRVKWPLNIRELPLSIIV